MACEIERKFLVAEGTDVESLGEQIRIVQGYLCSAIERTVRVRIKKDKGFLTIKGLGNVSGVSRFEFEKEISLEEAESLLTFCEPGVIDKTRTCVRAGAHIFEVDRFFGDNEGLIVAEVELREENEIFEKPAWLGREVTGDVRYYNSMLMKNPYKNWRDDQS